MAARVATKAILRVMGVSEWEILGREFVRGTSETNLGLHKRMKNAHF
jgi:hypothetical protein